MVIEALLLASIASSYQDGLWKSVGRWSIFKNSEDCAMMSTYEDGSMLRVTYTVGKNTSNVTIIDPAFKSAESGKKYILKVAFIIGNRYDDGWGEVEASGFSYESDGETKRGIDMSFNADEFLSDMARARTFGVLRGDIVVASLALAGSAPAIQSLRQCARIVHKENPADPLAD